MENTGWLKAVLVSVALVIAGYFVGNMHQNGIKYNRHVEVKGLSEREVKADLAVWPIQITLTGNDLKLLKTDIEQQKQQVQEFFLKQGFVEDELSMGSTNIDDARAQMYGGNMQNRQFRYIVKTEFTVRTGNIDKLQTALAESLSLISKGILIGSKNTWRPIEFIYTKLNEIKPSMIEEATMNAREVAEKFAKDSNSKVGKIKNARQGLFTINDRDQNSPHIKIVRVVSTVDYFLQD
ncbi:SIMPL domain-containing protein [Sunxiuqinia sp. sy24]|uniref:SIMPL domain-containing protein n=1 Tax=Sunxiuqinia sp. sy24 TaxID=3461495 RepID=UPI0040456039